MVDATPKAPFENPCIVYKPFTTDGGLERYATELAATFDAPLYTAARSVHPEHAARVDIYPFGERTLTEHLFAQLPLGSLVDLLQYENFSVPTDHDAVVTIGEQAKAVVHRPHQRRFHVLNMPPRWLFDKGPGRFDDTTGPVRIAKQVYQSLLRVHDVSTVSRLDDIVVPSETIARRCETYYERSPTNVVYPPVDTEEYRHEPSEGYILYLGRLAAAKGVTEIVESLTRMDIQLKVAGTGPLEDKLRKRSGTNVEMLGYVDERRKRELLARCKGLVFNSDDEAFGMVPIEAFASGKPVAAINDGYTRFQVLPDVNGVLFDKGGFEAAITEVLDREWDPAAIQESVSQYDIESFRRSWQGLLGDTT